MAGRFWQHSIKRGCADSTRGCNWTFVSISRKQRPPPHISTNFSDEEALVTPTDTKVSVDTIVQWICSLTSGPIAVVHCIRINREHVTHNLPKEN